MFRSFLLFLLFFAVACNPSTRTGYPSYPVAWSYSGLYGADVPALLGNFILNGILNADQTSVSKRQAFNLENRTPAWEYPRTFRGNHSIYLQGIAVISSKTGLYLINQEGQQVKYVPFPDNMESYLDYSGRSFQARDNQLYVPIADALLIYSVDKLVGSGTDIQPLWKVVFHNEESVGDLNSFAVDPKTGTVFVSGIADTKPPEEFRTLLQAYTPQGQKLWEKTLISVPQMPVPRATLGAGDGKVVLVLDAWAELTAYDTQGNPIWKNPPFYCPNGNTNLYAFVHVQDGIVMPIPYGDSCMSAWDLDTGKKKWVFDAPNYATFANRPVILNGVVYTANTYLWALDKETGKVLGRSQELPRAQGETGTVLYDAKRNQLLVWGDSLWAFKPLQ